MLVTSNFVVLNVPKSGSSFVREAIKSIYLMRCGRRGTNGLVRRVANAVGGGRREVTDCFLKELTFPNVRLAGRPADQHGVYSQVPMRFRHLPVVSVARNPYDKLVSDFEFRWWAEYPPVAGIRRAFPQFPELSLHDFLVLSDLVAAKKMDGRNPARIGNLTVEFVQFFFPHPAKGLARMSEDYVRSGEFRKDMADVTFLRQECLNEDLAQYLASFNYLEEELELCRRHPRVNETGGRVRDRASLWSSPALELFEARERYLFLMLEELGISCQRPALQTSE